MSDELNEALKREAFWRFKAECYAKDNAKLSTDLTEAQQEVCNFMCDLDRNRDPLIMAPQEYAELRGWHCYDKNRSIVYDPTVKILDTLQEIKEALCQRNLPGTAPKQSFITYLKCRLNGILQSMRLLLVFGPRL